MFQNCMVVMDRFTSYVAAVPCWALGFDAKKAVDLILQKCLFLLGISKDVMSDNDNVRTSDFFLSLCRPLGIERQRGAMYRTSSNGYAERAVKSVVIVLC